MNLECQITNIFIKFDDFCKEFDEKISKIKIQTLSSEVKVGVDRL